MTMKNFNIKVIMKVAACSMAMFTAISCTDKLHEDLENTNYTGKVDYSKSENMLPILLGVYAEFQDRGWEDIPLLSVRGDDVNAGGKGDQQDYAETDQFNYNKDFWMFNSSWQNFYKDILIAQSAMEQLQLYRELAPNPAVADQYIGEAKVIRAFLLFQLARQWGDVFIPITSNPVELQTAAVDTRQDVLEHISAQMDEAIPVLLNVHPNERTDIRGGVTRYTALAVKALANLELRNYQAVADATSQIISSSEFTLEPDFYQLFKLKGKLNDENILELQYSDFGTNAGDVKSYLFAFFGPENWTPAVKGANAGWGFFEPSLKYIKFMLDRGEGVRLQTSVLFTNRGIAEIKKDPKYTNLPAWINNTTPSGDVINDFNREMFASGKHYLPSNQLTIGRSDYGTNKNYTCIRYAEILLMHAEALKQGATSSVMSADDAVNLVRDRANLNPLTGVTLDQVMDEKFAELAMEWGTRFYDMVRLGRFGELSYEGRTFTSNKIFLTYPQSQKDLLQGLLHHQNNQ